MSEFAESIDISASPEAVWSALADIGRIGEWNPGVFRSEQTSSGDVGVGATRHCDLGGKNYLDEEVTLFEPYQRMTIRISDTNLPFEFANIRFTLAPTNGGTSVTVSPEYELKYGVIGRMLDSLIVRAQYRRGMQGLLQGLKTFVELGR